VTTNQNESDGDPRQFSSADNYARPDNIKPSTSSEVKPRFGLPTDFIPRFQRHGRVLLLEENIYSLPDGQEFVPCRPTGTLAAHRHLYALLTVSQFERGQRGSVFVRLDGRVFDYSTDARDPAREIFDTGYTIQDLQRTGRYASPSMKTKPVSLAKASQRVKAGKAAKT
jgi:hypothetical protein